MHEKFKKILKEIIFLIGVLIAYGFAIKISIAIAKFLDAPSLAVFVCVGLIAAINWLVNWLFLDPS